MRIGCRNRVGGNAWFAWGAGHDDPHVHPSTQVLKIQQSLLDRNQRLAERNRGYFRAKRLLVLNVVSAPGSGKTALIGKTGALLRGRFRWARSSGIWRRTTTPGV